MTTEYIQSNYYASQQPTGKPSVIQFLGVRMVRSHSIQAVAREIVNMSMNQDMISISAIGKQSSGKTQLFFTLSHLIHKFAKIPYQISFFGKQELLDLENTVKKLKPTNQIVILDDIAFLKGAGATSSDIDKIQEILSRIRHLPGGKDVRIILMKGFQYSKSIPPFLRQADMNFISTVDASDDIEALIGKKYSAKLKQLGQLRAQGAQTNKFVYEMGGGKRVIYEWKKPFLPFLYVTGYGARLIMSPLRSFIDPICNTCNPADTEHEEKSEDVKAFLDKFMARFNDGNVVRTAVKIKLIQQGVNVFSPRICQAIKYIEKEQENKIISIESLASALELTPTKTILYPKTNEDTA